MKKILLTILMVGFGLLLVACGGSNDSDLIGAWERDLGEWGISTLTFDDDGTGIFYLDSTRFDPEPFEWSTSGGVLTKEFDDGTEELEYEIDGSSLTLIENGNEFVYTRVD